MGDFIASQGHGLVLAWAAVRAHVWVHGPYAATDCVDVHDF